MSKDLFLQIQEQEAFDFTATKKDIIAKANNFADHIKESGEFNKHELIAKIVRFKEFINTIDTELRKDFTEPYKGFGIEITPMNGRKMIQYQEDPVYADLQAKIKAREELLKVAQTSEIYDEDGIEVPKVSVKFASDSLKIVF